MPNHRFIRKEIPAGADAVVEICICGAKRRRTRAGSSAYEKADGTWGYDRTECFGGYAKAPAMSEAMAWLAQRHKKPEAAAVAEAEEPEIIAFNALPRDYRGNPSIIEAMAIIHLLLEDRENGERCARNFLNSYTQ